MPPAGTFKWMCDAVPGPRPRPPRWRETLPDYEVDSARTPMGPRPAPFEPSDRRKAVLARRQRQSAKPAYAIVRSQLIIAKKRGEMQQNPCRHLLLRLYSSKSREFGIGDRVEYIRPGGRRVARPTKAVVLAFPDRDKKFVAVDRSGQERRGALLEHIDVVPRGDVWLP